MLSELFIQQDRDDLIVILRCIAYGLHSNKALSKDELIFLRELTTQLSLNDCENEQIYTIDIRYDLDIKNLVNGLSPVSAKTLLFISDVAVRALDSKPLRIFLETVLMPLLPFGEEIKKDILKTSPGYIKSVSDVYDFIWGTEKKGIFAKSNLSNITLAQKLFLIDRDKLTQISEEEKTAFYKVLIYLMLEDDSIDADEQKMLDSLFLMTGSDVDVLNNLNSHHELSINTIQSIQSDWVKRLVIYSYLYSKQKSLDDRPQQRINTILQGFNITSGIFDEFQRNISNYQSNYNQVIKSVLSNKISKLNDEKMSEYARYGLSAIGTAITFIPVIGPTLSMIDKISSTGGDIIDKRSSGIMKFGLTDILKDSDNETIVICVDGLLSELSNDQFEDWKLSADKLQMNAWIKGFKWPSGALTSFLKTGGSAWFEAVENTVKAGERLANDIDAIYGLRPETNIVLMGHSLGARVILNALIKLHEMKHCVHQIYLFGGAVSTNDKAQWLTALDVVEDKAYNFYSSNDDVLKKLYKSATLGDSPAGLGAIEHFNVKQFNPAELINIDVSDIINGHTEYKEKIPHLFKAAKIEFNPPAFA